MALGRWQRTITDNKGNVLAGASIEVRSEDPGQPLATLYSDRDGTVALGNPFTADSNGFAAFHAAGGAYQVKATKGGTSQTWRYVAIGLAQESDVTPSTAGDVNGPDSADDGQLAAFSGTDGKTISGAQTPGSPTANVSVGADTDVPAATDGKLLHAGHLASAAAWVALTDAPTVAVDWQAAINFTLEITGSRTLGNPTNAIPGTYRTIMVSSPPQSPTPALTLSFGSKYGGSPPTLDDISDEKWYALQILCVTVDHFIVTAVDGTPP